MIQTLANTLAQYIMCEIRILNRKNRVSTKSIPFKHAIIADDIRTFFLQLLSQKNKLKK